MLISEQNYIVLLLYSRNKQLVVVCPQRLLLENTEKDLLESKGPQLS